MEHEVLADEWLVRDPFVVQTVEKGQINSLQPFLGILIPMKS